MKKITFLLTLFLLCTVVGVAQTAAKYYKPGERKTTFAAGDKVFIYNTTKVNGTEDRTGFLRNTGEDKVKLYKQKPYGVNFVATENSGLIWKIESASEVNGVYTLQITPAVENTYLGDDGNPLHTDAQSLTVENYASSAKKCGTDVKVESTDGTSSFAPTADNKDIWAVYSSSNCWNGNGDSFAKWETAHPYAFYSVVESTDLDEVITAYNNKKAELQAKIGTITETSFALSEDNLSSNATQADDGEGISGLIDGNNSTFFHSRWKEADGVPDTYHCLKVDLGDAAAAMFKFGYTTRDHDNIDHPKRIRIWGSNDNNKFDEISVLTGADDGLVGSRSTSYESGIIAASKSYRYIRFDVEETFSNRKVGNFPYFALAEFNFKTVSLAPAEGVSAANAFALKNSLEEVQDFAASGIYVNTEVIAATDKMTHLVSVAALPFDLSVASAPVYYYAVQANRDDASYPYWTLHYNNGGKVKLETTSDPASDANKYWFFTLSENGYIKICPMAQPATSLGHVNANFTYGTLTNVAPATGFSIGEYEYVNTTVADYPIGFKLVGQDNKYLSNFGGSSNYLGTWSALTNDGGSQFKVTALPSPDNVGDIIALQAALLNVQLPVGATLGAALGQFTCSDASAYNNAVQALAQVGTADMTAVTAALQGVTMTQNLPVAGKFYRFKGNANNKYMSSVANENNRLPLVTAGNTAETVFYWDAEKHLVALTNGYCVGRFKKAENASWTVLPITDTKVGNVELIANTDAYGTFNIMASSNRYLNNAGDIVNVGGDTDAGYRWIIEDVSWLPVKMNTTVGYATLYSPVALGKGYSADRVKAYAGVVNENGEYLELNEITGDIPANTPVVLEYLAEAENGFVYLPVREEVEAYSGNNDLKGVVATQAKTANVNVYTLQSIDNEPGFYLFTGDNLGGFKSYLELPEGTNLANGLRFNGGVTGVGNVEAAGQEKKEVFYDLNGRLVAYPTKGIYVTGSGKKVLFK